MTYSIPQPTYPPDPAAIPDDVKLAADLGYIGRWGRRPYEWVIQRTAAGQANYISRFRGPLQIRRYVGTQRPTSVEAVRYRDIMQQGWQHYNAPLNRDFYQIAWVAWCGSTESVRRILLEGDWTSAPVAVGNYRIRQGYPWRWFSAILLKSSSTLAPGVLPFALQVRLAQMRERWDPPYDLDGLHAFISQLGGDRVPLDRETARIQNRFGDAARSVGPWQLYPQFIIRG